MSTAICFNLDQSKILSFSNELMNYTDIRADHISKISLVEIDH